MFARAMHVMQFQGARISPSIVMIMMAALPMIAMLLVIARTLLSVVTRGMPVLRMLAKRLPARTHRLIAMTTMSACSICAILQQDVSTGQLFAVTMTPAPMMAATRLRAAPTH